MRSRESYTPVKSRGTTPFSSRSTRSPSPAVENKKRTFSITNSENCEVHSPLFRGRSGTGTKMSLRKRSPSPVVTGKVSSFRSKFEPVVTNNVSQTIPRTYRLKARDPQDIFGHHHTQSSINSPGNYRFQKLSRDSSGMMTRTSGSNNPPSSLSRNPSTSRLPNHFISLDPPSAAMSSEVNKPKINRAQSLRTPRYFSPSDKNATQNAATYLRTMLPKKMAEDSKMRGPFGYNRS